MEDPVNSEKGQTREYEELNDNRGTNNREISDAGNESVDQVSRLQQQLDAKTDECCRLRSQLVNLKEDNAETVRAHLESQKRLFKVS